MHSTLKSYQSEKFYQLLFSNFVLQKAYSSPVPQSPPEEVYAQSGGPVYLEYPAPSDEPSNETPCGCPAAAPAPAPAPAPSPCDCVPSSESEETADINSAQALADKSCAEADIEQTVHQSKEPCKVETSSETEDLPGETFVHHPGPIYINQPPTTLVIKHAPYCIRPAPVVLNQGGKKITRVKTTKFMPAPVHIKPVIVRIVKPVEKKVLVEKPKECAPDKQVIVQPEIPCPCEDVLKSAPAPCETPAPPCVPAPAPAPCSSPLEIIPNGEGGSYEYLSAK